MNILLGKNIPLILQLVKSDNSFETSATVKYSIYRSNATTGITFNRPTIYNSTLKGYYSELDVLTYWSTQEIGHYILIWSVPDTFNFPDTIVDELIVFPGVVEGTYTHNDVLKIMLSALSGLSEGGGTPNLKFKDATGAKNRISATVDKRGNRTAVVLDTS